MIKRTQLFLAATSLLYAGPVLAGFAGTGWDVLPVFTAIFLLWLVVLRPHIWPPTMLDWLTPAALATFAARALVQVLLIALCIGIGRGLGLLFADPRAIPPGFAFGLSLASVLLCRLFWDPVKAQEIDALLDDALARIAQPPSKGPGRPDPDA